MHSAVFLSGVICPRHDTALQTADEPDQRVEALHCSTKIVPANFHRERAIKQLLEKPGHAHVCCCRQALAQLKRSTDVAWHEQLYGKAAVIREKQRVRRLALEREELDVRMLECLVLC